MSASRPFSLDFSEIDERSLDLVGGKALNLGLLARAGFPVPPGVCITTEAYRRVADCSSIGSIVARIASISTTEPKRLAELAAEARDAILSAPVPVAVTSHVIQAYSGLGLDAAVAVRSSATAEDLPFASFAGQQDTYLNVVGVDAVLNAVRRCWASLWTDRAVAYRTTNAIDHRSVRLAVVIQRMVPAEVAGVLFTANPVTGRRREAVIDASPGLGEAIVSGAVNPDRFVVDTASGTILERRVGDKRLAVRSLPGGGTAHVQSDGMNTACVSDDQIRALSALGDRVENFYGAPQDTEWAIDAQGTLWLTQARPITTLFPLPASATEGSSALRVYFSFNVAQGLYRPITPMGLQAARLVASSASNLMGFPVKDRVAGPPRFAAAGQRIFIDLTGVLQSRAGRTLMPRMLDIMESRSAVLLRAVSQDPRLPLVNTSLWPFMRRAIRIAARYRLPVAVGRALFSTRSTHKAVARVRAELQESLQLTEGASSRARLDFVEELLSKEFMTFVPRIMPAVAVGMGLLALAHKLLGSDASPDELQTVMRALPHNVTTEMDLELWALATRIRSAPEASSLVLGLSPEELALRFRAGQLPVVLLQGMAEFLKKYGHRAVAEIDVGIPRWSDDPQHLFGVLANYLRLNDHERAPDAVFARGEHEADEMVEALVRKASQRGSMRARLVRFALRRARAYVGLRELPKFCIVLALATVRRQLRQVGADLVAHGHLQQADDVFFLDLPQVRAGVEGKDLREVVSRHKEEYERELRRKRIPRVLLSDGTEPEALAVTAGPVDGALLGIPASAGQISGVARVIVDPVGATLLPGEILVAPSTDPGWTPLFLTAGGLVMEMGGPNSHGAVVAREYGIPAVVGVPGATSQIASGQRIAVDGSSGRVIVLD